MTIVLLQHNNRDYCVAQQHHLPQNPGNLPAKKKHVYIMLPAPGASKVTKLEPGGHFVCRNLFCAAICSKLFVERVFGPGRSLKSFLEAVAPSSPSMSPRRAMGTPFKPICMFFRHVFRTRNLRFRLPVHNLLHMAATKKIQCTK